MSILFLIIKTNFKDDKDTADRTIAMYIESESGEYELSTNSSFPREGYELNIEKSSCSNGGTLSQNETTKAISVTLSMEDKCTIYFDKEKFDLKEAMIAIDNDRKPKGVKSETPNFDTPSLDNGVYSLEDNDGMSYFYRGNIDNNYVKFGKWGKNVMSFYVDHNDGYPLVYDSLGECQSASQSNENCSLFDKAGKDMYWRIVRINGDGSLRLLYDGTYPHKNGEVSIDRAAIVNGENGQYNLAEDDAKYVGYMFGGSLGEASTSKEEAQKNETDSKIKTLVDEWYKNNFLGTMYEDYLADSVFCNDRTTNTIAAEWHEDDTALGYGKNTTAYGGCKRISSIPRSASFKCVQKNDAFTVSDTTRGNGALKYPIGLLTYDEALASGSPYYAAGPSNTYIGKGYRYATMTPIMSIQQSANIFYILQNGSLSYGGVTNKRYIVTPVINIKPETVTLMSGTGTMEDPFRIE